MKSKKRYWLLLVALMIPITFAGAHPAQKAASQRADEAAARKHIADDFVSAVLVAKDQYAGDVDFDKLTKASILGMLHTLDPHSNYFDAKEWEKISRISAADTPELVQQSPSGTTRSI